MSPQAFSKKTFELAITPGDRDGIGPEVTAKALGNLYSKIKSRPVHLFADPILFAQYKRQPWYKRAVFHSPPASDFKDLAAKAGFQAGWAVQAAAAFVMASPHSRALVTGPIHKERLNQGGYPFRGHTDFLGHLSGQKSITMLLANEIFRVALVSDHVSMTNLPRTITKQRVVETCGHAIDFATQRMGRKRPIIAVLGLNPHAGEGGLLGQEEASEISPALDVVRKAYPRVTVTGPWSADGFFATELTKAKIKRADVIVAMYHDQGLIPVKLVDFENCLNTTLGLPFIRTSVDHGTAFDIAKKNKANPSSMIYAIRKAYEYLGVPL